VIREGVADEAGLRGNSVQGASLVVGSGEESTVLRVVVGLGRHDSVGRKYVPCLSRPVEDREGSDKRWMGPRRMPEERR
jgi:hypothetical protein